MDTYILYTPLNLSNIDISKHLKSCKKSRNLSTNENKVKILHT